MTPEARIRFSAFGARIEVQSEDPAVLALLADRLPPGATPCDSPVDDVYSVRVRPAGADAIGPCYGLFRGRQPLAEAGDPGEIVDHLESLLHFNVATRARGTLFVHAGVVGWHGVAVVVPGRSMSGKTTLVEALVLSGATYYSDEYAAIDPSGMVHAYPKPLSLRSQDGFARRRRPISEYGGTAGRVPLPGGVVAALRYSASSAWSVEDLSPGQAVLALLDNTVLARTPPDFALPALGRLVLNARSLAGVRGDAAQAAARLLDYLDVASMTQAGA